MVTTLFRLTCRATTSPVPEELSDRRPGVLVDPARDLVYDVLGRLNQCESQSTPRATLTSTA